MSNEVFLAIDLGASSGRVIAVELLENELSLQEVHRFENQPIGIGKRLLWDVLGLWNQVEQGLGKAAHMYGSRIRSVGADTWGVDYVLLDKNDDFVGPAFCYRDSRTTGMLEQAFARMSKREIFQNSGVQFMEINTLYQLLSMRCEGSPQLDIADSFLMMPDFFHWQLSGEKTNEYTNASTTQMLNPVTRAWSQPILESMNLPSNIFRDPIQPATQLGPIREKVLKRTGLPKDCIVTVPASHDTGSAVIAVPASDFAPAKPDWCYISCGTWSLMGVELAEPILDDRCLEFNFTNEGGAQGSVRLLKNIAGLWPFQQLRVSLQRKGRSLSWESMAQMAESAPVHQAYIDLDDPRFVAPEDMLESVVGYLASTGQSVDSESTLLRVALESLAFKYRTYFQALEKLVGTRIEVIHMVGGGIQNRLLCQMTADACNRLVVAGPVEATALGNVVAQCVGLGRFSSILEARQWMRGSPDIVTYHPQNPAAWDDASTRLRIA
ncbi:rhamnulokinase [Pirellulaceae bacterium SH449]